MVYREVIMQGETFGQEVRTSHRTVRVMQTRDWITTIKE